MTNTIYQDIRAALETQLLTAAGVSADIIAWENVGFQPPKDTAWLRAQMIPATQQTGAMGPSPIRRDDGLYQVTVMVPQGLGPKAADVLADAVIDAFAPGTWLSIGSKTIRISYTERAPGLDDAPWYMVPITITWYTYINEG